MLNFQVISNHRLSKSFTYNPEINSYIVPYISEKDLFATLSKALRELNQEALTITIEGVPSNSPSEQ